MKWLYLYIIDGFPAIAVSHRPIDKLHMIKRVYYRLTGSTVIRFFAANHKISDFIDKTTGTSVMIVELKGGTK